MSLFNNILYILCGENVRAGRWPTGWSGAVGGTRLATRVGRRVAAVGRELRRVTPVRLVAELAIDRCAGVSLSFARGTTRLLDAGVVTVAAYYRCAVRQVAVAVLTTCQSSPQLHILHRNKQRHTFFI